MYLMLPNCTLTMVYFILCAILVFQHNFKTKIILLYSSNSGFPGSSDGKESACNAEDPGSIPESGRTLGKGAWQALVHGVTNTPIALFIDIEIFPYICFLEERKTGCVTEK